MSAVVVGYDQTAPSKRALVEAARQAARRHASLTVVTACQRLSTIRSPEVAESLELYAQRIAARGADAVLARYPDMPVEAVVSCGPTAAVLVAASRGADLLVVGCRGRGTLASLQAGSVSMRALNHSRVPTMVVRGSDHASRGLVGPAPGPDHELEHAARPHRGPAPTRAGRHPSPRSFGPGARGRRGRR